MSPCAALPAGLAGFADVFGIVVGVILSLAGLGLLLMGVISLADRTWKRGSIAVLLGAGLTVAGMWLVGVLG